MNALYRFWSYRNRNIDQDKIIRIDCESGDFASCVQVLDNWRSFKCKSWHICDFFLNLTPKYGVQVCETGPREEKKSSRILMPLPLAYKSWHTRNSQKQSDLKTFESCQLEIIELSDKRNIPTQLHTQILNSWFTFNYLELQATISLAWLIMSYLQSRLI